MALYHPLMDDSNRHHYILLQRLRAVLRSDQLVSFLTNTTGTFGRVALTKFQVYSEGYPYPKGLPHRPEGYLNGAEDWF